MARSVLRVAHQKAGVLPTRCVLSGLETGRALLVPRTSLWLEIDPLSAKNVGHDVAGVDAGFGGVLVPRTRRWVEIDGFCWCGWMCWRGGWDALTLALSGCWGADGLVQAAVRY